MRGDNLQNFGGGRLLLQRLSKFLEQARILNCDHRLSGEIFDQIDLLIAEGTYFLSIEYNCSDQFVVFQDRHSHDAASTTNLDQFDSWGVALNVDRLSTHVSDMDNRFALREPRNRQCRPLRGRIFGCCRRRSVNAASPCTATARKPSPSQSIKLPNFASQIRVAFSRMALNTGFSSLGELEMTCNTSDVAVCCVNESRSSLSNRAFWIATTACAAKLFTNSICFSGKWTHFLPIHHDRADELLLVEHWNS